MNKSIKVIGIIILCLTIFASCVGVIYPDIYQDNDFVKSMWFGNDLVTLFAVVLVMLISIIRSYRINDTFSINNLILSGCLWYLIYNYLYYAFGAAYNPLFIIYVAIISLSLVNIFFVLGKMYKTITPEVLSRLSKQTFKNTGIFMIVFAAIIGSMWIAFIILGLINNELPMGIEQTGHPTAVVFAMDLIFLVTPLLAVGISLMKKNPIALLLSFTILIKGVLYPVVLLIAGIISYIKLGVFDPMTPLYVILGIICFFQLKSLTNKIKKVWDIKITKS